MKITGVCAKLLLGGNRQDCKGTVDALEFRAMVQSLHPQKAPPVGKLNVCILTICHHEVKNRVISPLIEELGFEALVTDNSAVGMGLALRRKPSLIFLALDLPPNGAQRVIVQLANDPQTRHIPIICISEAMDKDAVMKALKTGAADFIVRPTDEMVVRKKISDRVKLTGFEEFLRKRTSQRMKPVRLDPEPETPAATDAPAAEPPKREQGSADGTVPVF